MGKRKEVECVDCGCDLPGDLKRLFFGVRIHAPRCDTCWDHYWGGCGRDCPIIGCKNASKQ